MTDTTVAINLTEEVIELDGNLLEVVENVTISCEQEQIVNSQRNIRINDLQKVCKKINKMNCLFKY